jgi:hypothetical protein
MTATPMTDGVCRSCGGSGWRMVMRDRKPTFRCHGTCGGTGLRRACGNRLAPAFICIGRPTPTGKAGG